MPSLHEQATGIADWAASPKKKTPEPDVVPIRLTFKPIGRPPKLTPELAVAIATLITEKGAYVDDACCECDVSRASYYAWKKQGEADRDANRDSPHRYFLDTIEKADAMLRNGICETAWTGDKKWLPRVTLGQRKYPERFAVRQEDQGRSNVTVIIGASADQVQVNAYAVSPAALSASVAPCLLNPMQGEAVSD